MYGIEIFLDGRWVPVNPPAGPPPYSFKTADEARTLARVLYPAIWDKPELCRVKEAA